MAWFRSAHQTWLMHRDNVLPSLAAHNIFVSLHQGGLALSLSHSLSLSLFLSFRSRLLPCSLSFFPAWGYYNIPSLRPWLQSWRFGWLPGSSLYGLPMWWGWASCVPAKEGPTQQTQGAWGRPALSINSTDRAPSPGLNTVIDLPTGSPNTDSVLVWWLQLGNWCSPLWLLFHTIT